MNISIMRDILTGFNMHFKKNAFKYNLIQVLNIPSFKDLEKFISNWNGIDRVQGEWQFYTIKESTMDLKPLGELLNSGNYLIKLYAKFPHPVDKVEVITDKGSAYLFLTPFGRYEGSINLPDKPKEFLIKLPQGLYGRIERMVIKKGGESKEVSGNFSTYTSQFRKLENLKVGSGDYIGYIDSVQGFIVYGWAFNRANPEERVEVVVLVDGEPVAEGVADQYREDLEKAEIGNGKHGFKIDISDKISIIDNHEIRVFVKGTKVELNNSPQIIISPYKKWIDKYEKPLLEKIKNSDINFKYKPKISIIMPVYNTPEKFLRDAIESVINQIYQNWELCIADDVSTEPHVKRILTEYKNKFPEKIKVIFRNKNGHICEASNSALSLATGDFVAFLDHDDMLASHALYMVVEAINENPEVKIIYSDEDFINDKNERIVPHFKPDWNPDLLLSQNYITHLLVIRKDIVDKIGGFRKGTEGAQDHDLVLRASLLCKDEEIHHIPQVLYHWRMWEKSTAKDPKAKNYTEEAGIKAIKNYFKLKGVKNFEVMKGKCPNTYRVKYPIPDPPPLVSIIIPTKDKVELLKKCVRSIIEKTDYKNYEIIIINHESQEYETYNFFKEIASKYDNIKILRFEGEFNYSAMNNFAVLHAKGELLLFLNNDMEVINSEWLREMVSHAVREEIGCVGAKLYYPGGTIQHAGVILGIGGFAGHSHRHFSKDHPGYFCRLHLIQNLSAVTGACLMVRKEVFLKAGGFDYINLKVALNDVDFCLKVRELGYRNLWTPYAELYHHESKSRGYEDTPEKLERFRREIEFMKRKWGSLLMKDPYYNPNLTLDREDFSIMD